MVHWRITLHDDAISNPNPSPNTNPKNIPKWCIGMLFQHPGYWPNNKWGYPSDVGIIVLENDIDFTNPFVKTCPIAETNGTDFSGQKCFITGWGRLTGTYALYITGTYALYI